jgi:hypothetical protein
VNQVGASSIYEDNLEAACAAVNLNVMNELDDINFAAA